MLLSLVTPLDGGGTLQFPVARTVYSYSLQWFAPFNSYLDLKVV